MTPVPNGCRWCGIDYQHHCQRWSELGGRHTWTEPTDAQRLARMRDRRAERPDRRDQRTGEPMTTAAPEPTPESTPEPTPETSAAAPPIGPPYVPGTIAMHVVIHVDTDGLWAEVPTLPGLFATGTTPTELGTSLGAAVESYLTAGGPAAEPDRPSGEESSK